MYVDAPARGAASTIPRARWRGVAGAGSGDPVGLGLVPAPPAPLTPDHGTRARYQAGCPCAACRGAEATYRHGLRACHRRGQRPLGSVISPVEAQRRIRQLKAEHVTAHQIAQALGLVHHAPRLHPDGITVRKLLKIRRLHRQVLRDGLPL